MRLLAACCHSCCVHQLCCCCRSPSRSIALSTCLRGRVLTRASLLTVGSAVRPSSDGQALLARHTAAAGHTMGPCGTVVARSAPEAPRGGCPARPVWARGTRRGFSAGEPTPFPAAAAARPHAHTTVGNTILRTRRVFVGDFPFNFRARPVVAAGRGSRIHQTVASAFRHPGLVHPNSIRAL